jgi:hypothetical protein
MSSCLTKPQLTRYVRGRLPSLVYDEALHDGEGTAIYTLSDPRDLRRVRYVGETRTPRRRFLQHVNMARLWLPEETPWWIESRRHRPLYEWIRLLYRDECRLPVMVIAEWVGTSTADARSAERALIRHCMQQGLPLLNIEARASGPQIPLL